MIQLCRISYCTRETDQKSLCDIHDSNRAADGVRRNKYGKYFVYLDHKIKGIYTDKEIAEEFFEKLKEPLVTKRKHMIESGKAEVAMEAMQRRGDARTGHVQELHRANGKRPGARGCPGLGPWASSSLRAHPGKRWDVGGARRAPNRAPLWHL